MSHGMSDMVIQASITVSCQKCGGLTQTVGGQEYHRCSFCSSLIQLAAVSVDRILPGGVSLDTACPACSEFLHAGLIEGRRVLYCRGCFGILLRHEDFSGIIQERVARRASTEPAEPRPIDPAALGRQLNCPSCRKPFEVHPYYGPGNIVVDTCAECGLIWLDHGELTRVEQASQVRSSLAAWGSSSISGLGTQSGDDSSQEPELTELSPFRILADLLL